VDQAHAFFTREVRVSLKTPTQFTHEVQVTVSWPRSKPVVFHSLVPASQA
jgi:hypothetical protein